MKKQFVLSLCFVLFCTMMSLGQQGTVIAGWTFDNENDTEFKPNLGLETNTWNLRAEGNTEGERPINLTEGLTTFAATATNWNNGAGDKYWSVRFRAFGFSNFKVSSVQYSSGEGPKNWKLQGRMSGTDWFELEDSEYSVGNDWTIGILNEYVLPEVYDNPGETTNLFIRWIMTDNEAVNGADVIAEAYSKIDDIIITGVNTTGIETVLYSTNITVFPNPSSESIYVKSSMKIETIQIYDTNGRIVKTISINETNTQLNINDMSKGLYYMTLFLENKTILTHNLVVE
jgi:hypothetical protein